MQGKAISLYNLRSRRVIENAPVKNQCSRDYFYGRDLRLETWLGRGEGIYTETVSTLPSNDISETAAALAILRDFTYLQAIRTERSVQEEAKSLRELYDEIFHDALPEQIEEPPSEQEIIQEAIDRWHETSTCLYDLKGVLVINESRTPFVISDHPATHTNRLHLQRFRRTDFGIQQSGMILTMPISPRHAALYYDGDVYTIPDRRGLNLTLKSDSDARAFNEFQLIGANENVYFGSMEEVPSIGEGHGQTADRRLAVHHRLNLLIEKPGKPDVFISAPAGTTAPSGRSLIHLESMAFTPRLWPSPLRFRPDAAGYTNDSAGGFVRRRWAGTVGQDGWRRHRFGQPFPR